MAFHFDRTEPVPDAVRRLVAEQLDQAAGHLTGAAEGDREKAVHEARKALKRSRAVIRLVRPVLGRRVARAENAALRDAGQALSAARDADVLLRTWDAVVADGVEGVDEATVAAGRRSLEADRDRLREKDAEDVGAVVEALAAARQRTAEWPAVEDSWEGLGAGLRRVHGQARTAMATALDGSDDEAWHEWRKRVKDGWYHRALLVPAWPEVLGAEEDEAHALSEVLGDDHDLAVLADRIGSRPEPWSKAERDALLAAVARRRGDLHGRAADRGRRLYAESPKAFAARLGAYWDAWRAGDGPA